MLDGVSTGRLIASQAYSILKKAGLTTFENEKAWKMYAEKWFETR